MVNYRQNQKRVNKNAGAKAGKNTSANAFEISKSRTSKGFYYSFLTIILILCLGQIAFSAILNVSKIIAYRGKINKLEKTRDAALALNEQLKGNINNFSNVAGLEEIARNNLKMASKDEVLVIINSSNNSEEQNKTNKKSGNKK